MDKKEDDKPKNSSNNDPESANTSGYEIEEDWVRIARQSQKSWTDDNPW